jgi:hypothetical protein
MRYALFLIIAILISESSLSADDFDVVVYGGTSAGVMAAIQVKRMGHSVVLIEPGDHIGGLTSGGLGLTDSGDKSVIGGLSREFYQRVKKHYDDEKNWTSDNRETFATYRKNDDAMWVFEPHVAEEILMKMLEEAKIKVVRNERLLRTDKGLLIQDKTIEYLMTKNSHMYRGKMFIDATYEGDLMALAGVRYTVGREANKTYGETMNGVARSWNKFNHRFNVDVDPYIVSGDPKSGLLPTIEKELPADSEGDNRIQAYCYRMCLTNDPKNRLPFSKPADYDERRYELLLRNYEAGDKRFAGLPFVLDKMPNKKTDSNNCGPVSTDNIGMNYDYPEANYSKREAIIKEHLNYQQGLMWTLANHPRVPKLTRDKMKIWGLAKDEFADNLGWSHQLYIREARRMVGQYVHSELDCTRKRETPTPVGMGSYNMDSHNVTRYVNKQGFVQCEGDVQEKPGGPYPIAYGSIIPKYGQCPNLLVPVCVSSSHIAYGSIRMEPVFMVLGHSAATAACLAIDSGVSVQKLDTAKLTQRLLDDKQVLTFSQK